MAMAPQVYLLLLYLVSFHVFVDRILDYNIKYCIIFRLNPLRLSQDITEILPVVFNGRESQLSVFFPAQKVAPFYEEWWFLVVVALVGLIFILLLVFILIIRGQSKKYAKKSESGECTQLHN